VRQQDELLGHEYAYSIDSFFQINKKVYELALCDIKAAVLGDVVDICIQVVWEQSDLRWLKMRRS
jgi:hypothetical protein